jgi:hypothetical protein
MHSTDTRLTAPVEALDLPRETSASCSISALARDASRAPRRGGASRTPARIGAAVLASLLAIGCAKDAAKATSSPDAGASEPPSGARDDADDRSPEKTGASRDAEPVGADVAATPGGEGEVAVVAQGDDPTAPRRLDPAVLDALWATREDDGVDEAELLGAAPSLEGKHYVAGNEKRLRVYREHLEGLRGGYIGVGTDQGYVFAGWMDADFAWFVDYDPVVKSVHDVYFAFFEAAKTPDEFMRLWSPEGKADALTILEAKYQDSRHRRARGVFTKWRGWIARRLVMQRKDHESADVASVLWDQAQYDRVRAMVLDRRIRPMTGNLLDDKAVPALAKSAKDAGIPVRVLYLSNAEEYWQRYTREFRENVAALPFDDKSVVVRTLLTWSDNMDYRYNLQPALNYVAWLEHPWLRRVYQMIPRKKPDEPRPAGFIEFSYTSDDPNDSAAARRAQKAESSSERK